MSKIQDMLSKLVAEGTLTAEQAVVQHRGVGERSGGPGGERAGYDPALADRR
jgi:hypothetical protein